MLGTVMERRKEIAVYNSIGLNPTHVFVFFVAEAVVFGLIGSVAGYLIGQGLAQVIVHFHWLPGVNLNYSSMAVMLVIFAAIVTVVVSTLYPAYIATRAAVPSGQRRWKLPPPVGDELQLDFPFSYGEQQLPGVLAYLQAFMDLNSEASSGRFLAQDARFGFVHDVDDRKVLAMTYSVTPVPFDLGVNQRMEVYGYYRPARAGLRGRRRPHPAEGGQEELADGERAVPGIVARAAAELAVSIERQPGAVPQAGRGDVRRGP